MLDATPTYLGFLAVAVAPAALVSIALAVRSPPGTDRIAGVALLTVVALAYTTPWDNALVDRGVWWYGDGAVFATLWHAPLGEYLFVVLQAVAVGLWVSRGLDRARTTASALVGAGRHGPGDVPRRDRAIGAAAGLFVGGVGLVLAAGTRTFYLGAILAWAGPVLALQWAVGWRHLLARRRFLAVGVLVPSTYCWLVDRVAIELGVWTISARLTTGVAPGGLPIEEAVFFLVTTLFVAQGLVLYEWVLAAGWAPATVLAKAGRIHPRLGTVVDRWG